MFLGMLCGLVNCVGIVMVFCMVGKMGLYLLDQFVWVININLVGMFNMI